MRLQRIEDLDLNLFDFDLDLTMMIFFLDADERVYARYGGRDHNDADNRQSLPGLRSTMESVLAMHQSEAKKYAPRSDDRPRYLRDFKRISRGGCIHCHHAKEMINEHLVANGKSISDLVFRYPPPDNLGFILDVDRSKVVKQVEPASPAARIGMRPGDVVRELAGVPIHSFADAQYALDRAPKEGTIAVAWQRDQQTFEEELPLFERWQRTRINWRFSVWSWMGSTRLFGKDLSEEEKRELGLPTEDVAFRQGDPVNETAYKAGIRAGDIIVSVDGKTFQGIVSDFNLYVQQHYVIGDRVTIGLMRDGRKLEIPLTLTR